METTIVYWGYIGIMEKKLETTIVGDSVPFIMENQMEKKMENEMETRTNIGGYRGYVSKLLISPLNTPCSSPLYNPLYRSLGYSSNSTVCFLGGLNLPKGFGLHYGVMRYPQEKTTSLGNCVRLAHAAALSPSF